MNLILHNNQLSWGHHTFPCTWGHGGIKVSKKEGDGATPIGTFPFRKVFYRPDRMERPQTLLPLQALTPQDGWCDDIHDKHYNQFITLPYKGRHEKLWRGDHVYDLILVVGYNDGPIRSGLGSAIFVHLLRAEGIPTEGCVALYPQDLLKVIQESTLKSSLVVIA
jgi:L,D-peptidoglycan transpeptidase YkuD (ErfK/YbiS/YcfS/YnhG family)